MTLFDRLLCALGLHDPGEQRRLGHLQLYLCRRPGCGRYVTTGRAR